MTETKWKRIQNRNCFEERALQAKIRLFSKEQGYIDRELQQILHAKESLLRSLRQASLKGYGEGLKVNESLFKLQITVDENLNNLRHEQENNPVKVRKDQTSNSIGLKKQNNNSLPGLTKTVCYQANPEKRKMVNNDISAVKKKEKISVDSRPEEDKQNWKNVTERKSCLRVAPSPRRDSRVRFLFPDTNEYSENKQDNTLTPKKSNYSSKSNIESLDEIKLKSKFYQIGSVALATAIFKTPTQRCSIRKGSLQESPKGQPLPPGRRRVNSAVHQPQERLLQRTRSSTM